jgi:hypothetical protein
MKRKRMSINGIGAKFIANAILGPSLLNTILKTHSHRCGNTLKPRSPAIPKAHKARHVHAVTGVYSTLGDGNTHLVAGENHNTAFVWHI